tara:strand:- start:24769 stop:26802 length:2034 start_codon:yes stop_codon:yes gene_type:complete
MSNYDEVVGLLREATIVGYDSEKDTIDVQLNTSQAVKGRNRITVSMPAPHSLFYNNGLFIGTKPKIGTPIIVGEGNGNQYYFVSFKVDKLPILPDRKLDELLIHGSDNSKITLDTKSNINIGSDINKIHIGLGTKNNHKTNLISFNFENENHFTQASRKINGLIKRDLKPNFKGFDQDSKLENDKYDDQYKIIGMDSSASANDTIVGISKNPPFVENRELIYEFQYQSDISSDLTESIQYGTSKQPITDYTLPNRRKSRGDTLSLTLLEPNYLMETIKGTVVDIFGNILDLNRMPLPIGSEQNTIRSDLSKDKQKSFLLIKELERKSLAYHFEINARKDFEQKSNKAVSTLDLLDINSNSNNSRLRSRFFIDIDKEGQFKINVPASSEKGNIPLLTRYENRSTYDQTDDGNPNKLLHNKDKLDIYLDSFAAQSRDMNSFEQKTSYERGSIKISSDSGEAAPIDRITKSHIMHGTAHHDILSTCYTFKNYDRLDYQYGTAVHKIDVNSIPLLDKIVSDTVKISGDKANAGGRSGSINLDGSIEFNIGANTVDRQSLWLDLAGGSVINLGRDINKRSSVISADGEIHMQIGGTGLSNDSRFEFTDGVVPGVLDIRILTSGGRTHMIRCDNFGITIMTPGNLQIHSAGAMTISADTDINIECENLTLQGRMILKESGGSI